MRKRKDAPTVGENVTGPNCRAQMGEQRGASSGGKQLRRARLPLRGRLAFVLSVMRRSSRVTGGRGGSRGLFLDVALIGGPVWLLGPSDARMGRGVASRETLLQRLVVGAFRARLARHGDSFPRHRCRSCLERSRKHMVAPAATSRLDWSEIGGSPARRCAGQRETVRGCRLRASDVITVSPAQVFIAAGSFDAYTKQYGG